MLTPIKNFLPRLINRLGLKTQGDFEQICFYWPNALRGFSGKSDNSKPLYLKGKILFVGCPNSLWANELRLSQEAILSNINHFLGQEKIKKLCFIY